MEQQLVFGGGQRAGLLVEIARHIGHLELFLDIDAQLLQGIDHLPLLNFDRNFSFRLALVDYNRQIEFIRRNLHLGTSVHLNITRESLLGLSEHRRSQYDRRR